MKYIQRRKLKQKIRQEREIKDIRQVKKQLREEIKSGQKNKMQQKEDRSENEAWGGDETFYFDLTSSVNLNESHWNRYSTLALALSAWATNRLSTCCSKQNKLFELFIEPTPRWRLQLERPFGNIAPRSQIRRVSQRWDSPAGLGLLWICVSCHHRMNPRHFECFAWYVHLIIQH